MINMKKPAAPLFLTAREAAGELSVSLPTLYAYVSRGLLRSEPVGESRARRYRADDVRALRARRASPGSESGREAATAVLDTAIGTISEMGPVYRGVPALALAETGTLEQAATLLWDAQAIDPFGRENMPVIDAVLSGILEASAPAPPLVRAITALAAAGEADPQAYNRTPSGRARIGARAMRLLAAALLGRPPSASPLHEQVAAAWAPRSGKAPDLLRRALVLLADHELNASTYTVRCAASTGLTLYDAVTAGLVAVKGPRHGGAGPLAAMMVAELASGDMAENIRRRIALGDRIPGFGHVVYPDGDPRADMLLKALASSGARPDLAVEAPARIADAIGLRPNIDFALAVLTHTLGLAVDAGVALFALARSAGWIAHAMEQLETGDLIRPRARYTGPEPSNRAAGPDD